MPRPSEDPDQAAVIISRRLMVAARLLLTPVIAVGGLLAPSVHPIFWLLLVVRAAWQLLGLLNSSASRWDRYPERLTPIVDVALTAASLATTGGSDSPLRVVVVLTPVAAGYLLSPRIAGLVGLSSAACYLGASAPDLLGHEPGSVARVGALMAALSFSVVAGVAFAYGREVLTGRSAEVARARRQLLQEQLGGEDRERRAVSSFLHEQPLQLLLAARQDVEEGDQESVRTARQLVGRAVLCIRRTIDDLHPAAIRGNGLRQALQTALEHRVRDIVSVVVEPEAAGVRERLVLSLTRDLGDALAAAGCGRAVALRLSRDSGAIVLGLSASADPDGPPLPEDAMAAVEERVRTGDGMLMLRRGPDGRTSITVRLFTDAHRQVGSFAHEEDIQRRAQLLFCALRLLLVPVAVLIAELGGDPGRGFAIAMTILAAYYVGVGGLSLTRHWRQAPGRVGSVWTLALFVVAVAVQGGAETQLPALAVTFPFLFVLTFRVTDAVLINGVLAVALVAVLVPELVTGAEPAARADGWSVLTAFAWSVGVSLLIGTGRERMRIRLIGLEADRRRLLYDSLVAADEERRRRAEELHDGVLQDLMSSEQELDRILLGTCDDLRRAGRLLAAGTQRLRETLTELHPPALEHGGLGPAVTALVEQATGGRLDLHVQVAPDAGGSEDELVLALVRELVINVVKHAAASRLAVQLGRVDGQLTLDVRDDGLGIPAGRLAEARRDGHIGLASAFERVRTQGGRVEVDTAPFEGTRIRVVLGPQRGPAVHGQAFDGRPKVRS